MHRDVKQAYFHPVLELFHTLIPTLLQGAAKQDPFHLLLICHIRDVNWRSCQRATEFKKRTSHERHDLTTETTSNLGVIGALMQGLHRLYFCLDTGLFFSTPDYNMCGATHQRAPSSKREESASCLVSVFIWLGVYHRLTALQVGPNLQSIITGRELLSDSNTPYVSTINKYHTQGHRWVIQHNSTLTQPCNICSLQWCWIYISFQTTICQQNWHFSTIEEGK